MAKIKSFQDCLEISSKYFNKRHLLLGNGFSRACRNEIFSYDSLFDAASWNSVSEGAKNTFAVLNTVDFEFVMESLENCSRLVPQYNVDKSIAEKMSSDAIILRNILVETLARHHPEFPNEIAENEFKSAISFLENFEKIYTVNYDLLLYWALFEVFFR